MKTEHLRTRRAELAIAYAQARRRHRAQGAAFDRLQAATTTLLRAEIQAGKPRRGRPPNPRPVNPDLFASEARP